MGLYLLFSLPALLALVLLLAALRGASALTRVTLLLLLLCCTALFLLALVAAVLLTVGNDGCANLEGQILARVADIGSSSESNRVVAIGRYYLYGEGGPLRSLLRREFDIDLDALTAQALSLRDDVLLVRVLLNAVWGGCFVYF